MPVRWPTGKPRLGAKGMPEAPAIFSTAASLRPETPDSPSTNAASRQRTRHVGGDVGDGGCSEASRQLQPRGVDRHLEDRAVQRLGVGAAGDLERLGREHGAPLLDLLDALVALHGLDAHRVGHDQERPEDLLLRAPELADLRAHRLRPALALPDEPVDEQEGDEQQEDQNAIRKNLKAGLRSTRRTASMKSIMIGRLPNGWELPKRAAGQSCGERAG